MPLAARISTPTFVLGLSALMGCSEDPSLTKLTPVLEVTPAVLDFGDVPMSSSRLLLLGIQNTGSGPLELSGVELEPPYALRSPAPISLAAGARATLRVAFHPVNLDPTRGRLILRSDDPSRPELAVTLEGQGAIGLLDVRPAALELGAVPVAGEVSARFMITNRGEAAAPANLNTSDFDRPESYSMPAVERFGLDAQLSIPAMSPVLIDLDYHPLAAGSDDGTILIETCGPLCGLEVQVAASSYQDSIRLEPLVADFGTVALGASGSSQIQVHNDGPEDVLLLALSTTRDAELSVLAPHPPPFTIAAGASAQLSVGWRPSVAGELEAGLLLTTSLAPDRPLRAALLGRAAGPLFALTPGAVHFGDVTRSAPTERAVLLSNQGSSTVRVNSAAIAGDPAFSLGAGSTRLPISLGAGESATLMIRFSPGRLGEYLGSLNVISDDPKLPAAALPLTATYQERQCQLDGLPQHVSFGASTTPMDRMLSIPVHNSGPEHCTLSNGYFRMPSDSDIVATPRTWPIELDAGEGTELAFELQPHSGGQKRARYAIQTADGYEHSFDLFGLVGLVCSASGTASAECECLDGARKVYRRFDGGGASGILPGSAEGPFHLGCADDQGCGEDEVLVETDRAEYACAPPVPSCWPGQGLEWSGTAWSCIPCAVVVRYGSIYDHQRVCAPLPPAGVCSGGTVSTFRYETRAWQCDPVCNNGLYDQVLFSGQLVCVPC